MMPLRSGKESGMPYSLSRWTDVPAGKWPWLLESIRQGHMDAFDPETGFPGRWSLKPEDTLGLVFWTKDPRSILADRAILKDYRVQVHVTMTDWYEVEIGAPRPIEDRVWAHTALLRQFLPAEDVIWRFSPVPLVSDVVERFERIADRLSGAGFHKVFLSFLQTNDKIPEVRSAEERVQVMRDLAAVGAAYKIDVRLCNEDQTLQGIRGLPTSLASGVCAPPEDWALPGRARPPSEGCGCTLMVDPFTINESCTLGCQYCLDPDTLVLYEDFGWRPLGEVRIGDTLVGFDENPESARKNRKFRHSVVEGVWWSRKPVLRIVTESTEVFTTEDHLWFEGKTRKAWKRADHLALDCKLQRFDVVTGPTFSSDYKIGYITGMHLGDGTMRVTESQRPLQPYWRVALVDEEPLLRLQEYLQEFGVSVSIRPFDSSSPLSRKPMQKVETRSIEAVKRISGLMVASDTDEYRRGFLAGLFDSEGSYNGSLRIHQIKDNGLLDRASSYASKLGISMPVESSHISARVGGGLRQYAKFFSMTRPTMARKADLFFGRAIDFAKDPIVSIERVGERDVVDIRTSTRTFMAAGLATHNCYASDKTIAPKKRNTTRRLPVVR